MLAAIMLVGCSNDDETGVTAGIGVGSTSGNESSGMTESASETATVTASASNSGSTSGTTTSVDTSDGDTSSADGSSSGDTSTTRSDTDGDSSSGEDSSDSSGSTSTGGESSSSTGDEPPPPDTHQLYQGAYNGLAYEYGFEDTIEILDITGGPDDTDWTRWAMLNDDGTYRLYFMQEGSDDTLYQFAYNAASQDYEYGFGAAIDILGITGAPADADMSSFAMLYSGTSYRLYALSATDPLRVHQFVYNPGSQNYEYGLGAAFETIDVTMFPAATDFSGWGMLWEDEAFRFYGFADAAHDAVAQGAYNSVSGDYEYGFDSIPEIDIVGFPADTNTDDFAMLHDGEDFRLYMLRE